MEISHTSLNHRFVTLDLIAATALAVTLTGGGFSLAAGQDPASRQALEIMALSATTDVSVLRRLDAQVDALVRADALALASRWPDPALPGHVHESFRQFHAGVPVYGGGVSRQLATGVIVSIFGTIYPAIDLDTTPSLPPDEALALIAQQAGTGPATDQPRASYQDRRSAHSLTQATRSLLIPNAPGWSARSPPLRVPSRPWQLSGDLSPRRRRAITPAPAGVPQTRRVP